MEIRYIRKFPVTTALLILQVLLFVRPKPLQKLIPPWYEVCPTSRLHLKDVKFRYASYSSLSSLFHVSSFHLLYDTSTFLWTGATLEKSMGSVQFAVTLLVLEGLSQYLRILAASWVGALTFFSNTSKCAVGFSSTLFALKVALENRFRGGSALWLRILLYFSIWGELLLVHTFVPGMSFSGHLCGIVAGYMYASAALVLHANFMLIVIMRKIGHFLASSIFILIGKPNHQTRQLNVSSSRQEKAPPQQCSNSLGLENSEELTLVWYCRQCIGKNGVFISNCEGCGLRRDASYDSEPSWSS